MDIKVWIIVGTLLYEGGAYVVGVFTDEDDAEKVRGAAAEADHWYHFEVIERTLNVAAMP
jgi:hypothetical protein